MQAEALASRHAELKDRLRSIGQGFDRLRRVSHQGYGAETGEPPPSCDTCPGSPTLRLPSADRGATTAVRPGARRGRETGSLLLSPTRAPWARSARRGGAPGPLCRPAEFPGTRDPRGPGRVEGWGRGWPQCLSPCPPGAAHLDRGSSCWSSSCSPGRQERSAGGVGGLPAAWPVCSQPSPGLEGGG